MPRAPRTPAEFAQLPTEATHPRAAKLDTMAPEAIAALMLGEEAKAVRAAQARADVIGRAARLVADRLAGGGRLIYVGAGTSGRLGTLDAVECVPTFGVPPSRLVPIIAGGPAALTRSVEGAEDNVRDGEQRMRRVAVGPADVVCCVAASGTTPFVRAALEYARFRRAATILVTCRAAPNDDDAPRRRGDRAGHRPEVIAGSTRLKAGTATKMALNAMSTAAFVLLGKTYGGLMVDVRPTNAKLWARADPHRATLSGLDDATARRLIEKAGGRAKVALVMHHAGVNATRAKELLVKHKGSLRAIVGDVAPGESATPPPPATGRAPATERDDRRSAAPPARRARAPPRASSWACCPGPAPTAPTRRCARSRGFGENTGLVARAFVTTPFPRPLRERIYRLAQADASELCDLDVLLGETFADAAFAVRRGRASRIDEVRPHRLARPDRRASSAVGRAAWARRCRSARPP